jgi:NADH-quinone oxidoreductase subunit J
LLLVVGLALIFDQALSSLPQGASVLEWKGETSVSDAKQVGELLFTKYLLPFLATSVLLLVATVGVVLLSKREVK